MSQEFVAFILLAVDLVLLGGGVMLLARGARSLIRETRKTKAAEPQTTPGGLETPALRNAA